MINTPSNLPAPSAEPPHGFSFPLAEEKEAGAGFTLLQLWYMVRAHLWLSIGLFAVLVALAFVGIKNLPKSYVATATLIVNSDNTDPLAGRNYPIGQQGSFFPTQVELINNSVMLVPVIDRLKLQEDKHFTGGFVGDPKTLKDIVLANLRSSLEVAPGRGSQMLYISATSGDPLQAADIANAVADEYLRQNGQRTNAPNVEKAQRYSEQLAELKSKSDAKQAELDNYRQRNDMAELTAGQNGDAEGATMYDLQTQLQAVQKERRVLQSKQVDARANSSAVLEMPEVINLQSDLDKFEADLAKARAAKLGPNHPTVTKLQGQIDATKQQIQAAVRARSDNLAMQLKSTIEAENKLQAEIKRERSRVLNRRTVGDEGSRLLTEAQNAKDAYANALKGQDQVQFASAGNYQDVSPVGKAEPPVKAAKPNKMKLFAMALMACFGLALGGPFAYELLLDRRIRCRDDLEKSFGIVTLAQFGPVTAARAA